MTQLIVIGAAWLLAIVASFIWCARQPRPWNARTRETFVMSFLALLMLVLIASIIWPAREYFGR